MSIVERATMVLPVYAQKKKLKNKKLKAQKGCLFSFYNLQSILKDPLDGGVAPCQSHSNARGS